MHIYKFATLQDGRHLGLRDLHGDLDKEKPIKKRQNIYTLEAWSIAKKG